MHTTVVLVIDENSFTQERRFILIDTGLSSLKNLVLNGILLNF